jgi:hypothetical protein
MAMAKPSPAGVRGRQPAGWDVGGFAPTQDAEAQRGKHEVLNTLH